MQATKRDVIEAVLFLPGMLLVGVLIFAVLALFGLGARFVGTGIYEAARHWLSLPHPVAAVLALAGTIAAVYGLYVVLHRRF